MFDSLQRLGRGAVLIAALAALLTVSPALGQDATPGASNYTPPDDIAELEGSITSDGSSTVGPITQAAAEGFAELAPNVESSVSISGTGGGFTKFCEDETDLQNASRPINEEEAAICAENGIDFYEFEIAFDGLTVVVPESNTFLTCISTDLLRQIWLGEITNFNAVNPEFPDLEIQLFGPDTESGTYDFFNEEILGEDDAGETIEPAADFEPSSDDNVLVEGVSGTEGGLGHFGYAYYQNAEDRLNAVAITADGDLNNCVAPSPETVRDGSYQPLSRPLYIYVKASSLAENPAVQEFMRYTIADSASISQSVGYVDAPAETIAASAEKLEGAIAGSVAPDSQASEATAEA